MVRKRYCRARSCTPAIARQHSAIAQFFYRLKAKIDVRPIADAELQH
jgi:hypothetical protein